MPARLIHRAVVAENNPVFRARVAVFSADNLGVKRHAVHRPAIAAARRNTANVRAVCAQLAIGIHRRRTVIAERVAFFHRNIRVGIFADPFGDEVNDFIGAGEFRVLCINRLIENTELNAFTGISRRVGFIGVNSAKPPLRIKFAAAPAGGIARFALLNIITRRRLPDTGQT